jgi:hypothetical protein
MNLIPVAGLCSLLVIFYTLRLIADGKKLEKRLLEKRTEFGGNVQKEELLIKEDYAKWMTLPFCNAGAADSASDIKFYSPHINPCPTEAQFGQLVIPGTDRLSNGRN